MAFNKLMLTTDGKTLYAKAQQGKPLHFTRFAIGNGLLGNGSLVNRTALISEKKSMLIDSILLVNGSESAVVVSLSNSDITEGFYFNEMILFAQDPDTHEEKSYLYDNSIENGEFLPPASSGTIINERLKLLIKIDNTVSVTFNASGNPLYLSVDDIADGTIGSSVLWSSTYIDQRLTAKQATTNSLPEDTNPDSTDYFATYDTATGTHKKVLLGALGIFLKSVFDSGYAAVSHTHTQSQISDFAHKNSHKTGGTDALTPSDIGAAKRISKTATLATANWTGSAAPYTYVLSDADILAADTPHIDRVTGTDAAAAALINTAWGLIAGYAVKPQTAAGKITFYASAKPATNIPIMYEVVRS